MRKLLIVLFVSSLAFSGCGGGNTKDASDVSASESTDEGGPTTAPTETTVDTNFSGKGSGDFCAKAAKYQKEFDNVGDSTDAKATYQGLVAGVKDMASSAPKEIKDDVNLVKDMFVAADRTLAKYDYDSSKVPESEAKALQSDSAKITAANNRVESYLEKVCKIDSDGDGDTDGVIDNSIGGQGGSSDGTDETTDSTTTDG